ncbi:MAG: amino acid deaminase [Lentisphaeraceae bacterium]|nr:amino acid deaminase [Lentisphaeraceae bacterium]
MTINSFLRNAPAHNNTKDLVNLLAEDFMMPAMTVKQSHIVNNAQWMQEYANKTGVKLAPHGKTTMCPYLFSVQLEQGAWGMTLANAFQVKVAHQNGVKKILMANQLVGRQNISQVLHEIHSDKDFEFYCLVDNIDNIKTLAAACRDKDLQRPLNLLIEIAPAHGRAGVRTSCEVIELAQEIKKHSPWIQLAGIECYEGVIHSENPIPEVNEFLSFVAKTAVEVEELGLYGTDKLILTGGGTVFFDRVCDILPKAPLKTPFEVLIRPGCYLSHDSGIYDEFQNQLVERDEIAKTIDSKLESAIEVLTYVQSLPEPGLAILSMGKRDVSFDSGLPTPITIYKPDEKSSQKLGEEWSLTDLNDQHAFMKFPIDASVKVGDIIISQVSHPCLTFDKWQAIALIDDDYNVIDMLKTYFG